MGLAARRAWTSGNWLSQEREVLGQLAVLEAQVELLTDGQREAGDFAIASHRVLRKRSIVSMRGNDNRNASRLKSYRRFLNKIYLLLMDADLVRIRLVHTVVLSE